MVQLPDEFNYRWQSGLATCRTSTISGRVLSVTVGRPLQTPAQRKGNASPAFNHSVPTPSPPGLGSLPSGLGVPSTPASTWSLDSRPGTDAPNERSSLSSLSLTSPIFHNKHGPPNSRSNSPPHPQEQRKTNLSSLLHNHLSGHIIRFHPQTSTNLLVEQ